MKFQQIPWTAEAESKLRRAMKYMADVLFIRGEVCSERAQLWMCNGGEAYMVTRNEGNECVIVCFEGEGLREAAETIVEAAARGGFQYIRWHTQNPAINRALRFLNPEPLEYVMRASTDGKQIKKLDNCESDHHEHSRH